MAITSEKQFVNQASEFSSTRIWGNYAQMEGSTSLMAPANSEFSLKEEFQQWLETKSGKNYAGRTVYKYVRALDKTEEWLSIKLPVPIYSISEISIFDSTCQLIRATEKFDSINREHGNGDLSAAMTAYKNFLEYRREIAHKTKKSSQKTLGIFDSWEIVDENTAIKHCDRSFFEHKGSDVPKGITWFFDAEELAPGGVKNISIIFDGNVYQGRVSLGSTEHRQVRIFWGTDLSEAFGKYNTPGAMATFRKITDDTYEVSMKGGETEMTIKENITAIKAYIAAKGFNYEGDLIENFYLSLKSKPFVILAGTSGTGKTKLVEYFAEAIGAKMQLVPVRPDWSDSSDLFGHKDLSGNFHPGAIIDFIKSATDSPSVPHFLCLDEMNLARVEYYMSDLLSIIETRRFNDQHKVVTKPLIAKDYCLCANGRNDYGELGIPDNLYIIGTVNMDETTFPFSKKVLDRANTIEFSFVDLTRKAPPIVQYKAQELDNSFLKAEYLHLIDCGDDQLIDDICFDLNVWNQILVKANLHVGYRVRDEICFYMMNNKKSELLDFETAFDHEIMQKILPRVQGSSSAIKDVLSELFVKCAGDYTGFDGTAACQMKSYLDTKPCKYPNSAKKIAFMMRRYEEDGFTSYWI